MITTNPHKEKITPLRVSFPKTLTDILNNSVAGKYFEHRKSKYHFLSLIMGEAGYLKADTEIYSPNKHFKGRIPQYILSDQFSHITSSGKLIFPLVCLTEVLREATVNLWFKHESSYYHITDLDMSPNGKVYSEAEVYSLAGEFKGNFHHYPLSDNFELVSEKDLPMGPFICLKPQNNKNKITSAS